LNINPFVQDQNFLGGKTGTSPEAKENFAGVFTFHGRRVLVVVLGSENRVTEVKNLFTWADTAFTFPQ
jgi:D-alanyl-D-alanine carboxypeptidase